MVSITSVSAQLHSRRHHTQYSAPLWGQPTKAASLNYFFGYLSIVCFLRTNLDAHRKSNACGGMVWECIATATVYAYAYPATRVQSLLNQQQQIAMSCSSSANFALSHECKLCKCLGLSQLAWLNFGKLVATQPRHIDVATSRGSHVATQLRSCVARLLLAS